MECGYPAGEANGLGFSHKDLLTLLPDIPAIYPVWKRLVQDHRIQGVKVYDARLVAVMSVYLIDTILTLTVADFKRYA